MKSATHPSMAERFGQALGRTYNRLRRQEARTVSWLVRKGVPVSIGKGLLWGVKLLVLAVLLYAAFWLALLLVFALSAAWVLRHVDWEDERLKPQWRDGVEGYGYYENGFRTDFGRLFEDDDAH
ncbi:hypothetical protein BZL41_26235 [Pseudomonas sp. PIC25]|uniref:DUF3742 family protein n=1 Tax=Pseudomonas sp. PIC25 TaxID=1958773 RepID=UPI000BABD103|nr:DUF3742 family protein [Pseudomonas sp. PIC25]PAU51937.1 hypothetical protein BZL41_26235 [Pseudomonas sp. PIC25]